MFNKILLLTALLLLFSHANWADVAASADTDPINYITPSESRGGMCRGNFDTGAPIINNGFAADLSNTRNYSSIFSTQNVGKLTVNFVDSKYGLKERRGAPFINDQALVFIEGNAVTAINRQTGCQYWSHTNSDHTVLFRSASVIMAAGQTVPTPRILVGDANGYIHALDASDGSEIWKVFAGTIPDLHYVTGGLQAYNGSLFVPVSSKEVLSTRLSKDPCCSSHGMLTKVDIDTGTVQWRYHTTAEPTIKTAGRIGPSGAPLWGTPAIDPERNAVYFGTGENYSEPATLTSDAIISVDMDSGEANWIFQATANDMWNITCDDIGKSKCPSPEGQDFDFGAGPIVIDDGKVILAGDKAGTVYALNADNGEQLWRKSIGAGSTLGGIHWGMAVDADTVYAAVTDLKVNKASGENRLTDDASPGIYALSIQSGDIKWSIHPTQKSESKSDYPAIFSASLSVSNDVLFAASLDGTVWAFSTQDGAELYNFDTAIAMEDVNGNQARGGTIDSVGVIVAEDSLVVNSGYSAFHHFSNLLPYQAGPGNALLVFHLAETSFFHRNSTIIYIACIMLALFALLILRTR